MPEWNQTCQVAVPGEPECDPFAFGSYVQQMALNGVDVMRTDTT